MEAYEKSRTKNKYIKIINKKGNKMRIVKVKYLSTLDEQKTGGKYYYQDNLKTKLKKYDIVLVPTYYGFSLAVVDVIDVTEDDARYAVSNGLKEVSEKIKSSVADKLIKKDKIKDIKVQLDKKIKEIDSVEKYKMYAKLSPEVEELIKQLEEASK